MPHILKKQNMGGQEEAKAQQTQKYVWCFTETHPRKLAWLEWGVTLKNQWEKKVRFERFFILMEMENQDTILNSQMAR